MGQKCALCGGNLDLLSKIFKPKELKDGSVICGKCIEKVGILAWNGSDVSNWTMEDVKKQIEATEESKRKISSDFHASKEIYQKDGKKELILAVDEAQGIWHTSRYPDLFLVSQIAGWDLSLHYNTDESAGFHLKFTPPRPEMPVPGMTDEIDGLSLVIRLKNHPYAEEVELPITGVKPFLKSYRSYLKESYDFAEQCYQFLESLDTNASGEIEFS